MEIDVRLTNIENSIKNLNKTTKETNEMLKEFSQGLAEQKIALAGVEYKTKSNEKSTQLLFDKHEKISKLLWGLLVGLLITSLGLVGSLLLTLNNGHI